MSVFRRRGVYVSKFQANGIQHWTPGGPWEGNRDGKRQALEAERRYRDRLTARRTAETCASFADRWVTDALFEVVAECEREPHTNPLLSLADRLWEGSVPDEVRRVLDRVRDGGT